MVECIYLLAIQLLMSFIETSLVLKTFSYTVCLNLCPLVQRYVGIILFLIVFSAMTVKI